MPAFCSSSRTIWRIRSSAMALRLELDTVPRLPDELLLPVPPAAAVRLLLEPGLVESRDDPEVPGVTCAKAVPPKASKAARVQVFDRCFFIITPCLVVSDNTNALPDCRLLEPDPIRYGEPNGGFNPVPLSD